METNWVHSALRPPIGLLCKPRVIMMMEKLVEWLAGETEVLEENLTQCRFVHQELHRLPECEPGPPRGEANDWKQVPKQLKFQRENRKIWQDVEWTPESVWTKWRRENSWPH
jgi:hypothetical protein